MSLIGRVEDWRAGKAEAFRPCHVSSPLHVARMRISRTALSCLFLLKARGTYLAGATFSIGLPYCAGLIPLSPNCTGRTRGKACAALYDGSAEGRVCEFQIVRNEFRTIV